MMKVNWQPQTAEPWDPPATIITVRVELNGHAEEITGVYDPGADFTVLQPSFIATFAVDEDACGYLEAEVDKKGNVLATVPLAMALGRFAGQDFRLPIQFDKQLVRPCLFGRSGFGEHFRVTLEASTSTTTFEWQGQSPSSTLKQVEAFIASRVGKRPKPPPWALPSGS